MNKVLWIKFPQGCRTIMKICYALLLLWSSVILTQCKNNDQELDVPKTIHLTEIHKLETQVNFDFITIFQFAHDDVIWAGTFNSGIYQITGNSVKNFSTSNSLLPNNRINDIFIDHRNRVWVATDNGLAMYQNNIWEVYDLENTPLFSARVSQVAVSEKNEVLIGNGDVIDGGLLFRSQNGLWKRYTTENSLLPCNFILEIELGNGENFWVSTGQLLGQGGVAKFENQEITEVLNVEKSDMLYNWVDNIEISDTHLWTGFEVFIYNESGVPEGGIQRINMQTQEIQSYFPHGTGLVSNRISAMKLSSDNTLWFTTIIDDPACTDCFSGIGMLSENDEFLIASSLNSDIAPNAFFPELREDNKGNMYTVLNLSIYHLELTSKTTK